MPGGQHLRLHRPGARGVGQHHPRAGPAQGARAGAGAHRHRLPHPALRRRDPHGDSGGQRDPRHLGAAPHRGAGEPGRRAAGLGERARRPATSTTRRPRGCSPAGALRLREDRRGLRHGLHVLRDPAVPRPAPEPPAADIVAEVEGLAARGIQEAILVSQDTLAYGRDLPGNGDIGDLLLALSDTTMPWIRPDVPASRPRHRAPHREVAARAGGAVSRHAGAARRRRDPARHAPGGDRAAHEGHRRPAARRDPRRHPPHHRAGGLPGRDRGRVRQPARLRRGRRPSTGSASSPTRWRRARRPPTWPTRCRPR